MLEQKQLFRHNPEQEEIGDCFRTCIACLLDEPAIAVPHVMKTAWGSPQPGELAHTLINNWLKAHDRYKHLRFCEVAYSASSLEDLLKVVNYSFSSIHLVLGCSSRIGNHSVIIGPGNYMWDPSLDNTGCVGPMDDGYWRVGFLARIT